MFMMTMMKKKSHGQHVQENQQSQQHHGNDDVMTTTKAITMHTKVDQDLRWQRSPSPTLVDDDDFDNVDDDYDETRHAANTYQHAHQQQQQQQEQHLSMDEKSLFHRAYDLIDRTARILRPRPTSTTTTTTTFSQELGEWNLSEFDVEQAMFSHHGEECHRGVLVSPVVARARAKAASAYLSSTITTSSSSSISRSERRMSLEPGAEYVPARAPGLSPAFYLNLVRGENSRRADEMQQATQHQATTAHESSTSSPPQESSRPLEAAANDAQQQDDLSSNITSDGGEEKQNGEKEEWNVQRLRRSRRVMLLVVVCILVVAACGLGIDLGYKKTKGAIATVPLATTQFDAITWNCATLHSQVNPNVISQCHCTNKISTVAEDIQLRYNELTANFITQLYPNFDASSIDSCVPQNQALLWLASADGIPYPDASLSQRYILALLFILWNGPQWTVSEGWLSSNIECSWNGVSCDRFGQVIGIDLYNNNVNGILGSDFSQLTALTALTMSLNGMKGSLPTELGNLGALTILSLDSNQLTGAIPSELGRLSVLSELHLGNNQLSGTFPTWIGQLQYLNTLNMLNNTFTPHSIPTEIGLLTNLQNLVLGFDNLTGTIPTELFALESLQILDLGSNSLTGTLPSLFGNLVAIGTLPPLLFRVVFVVVIVSCSHPIMPLERRFFLSLVCWLENLGLDGNHFTGTIPFEFVQCTELAFLFLSRNQLHGTLPSTFWVLSKLGKFVMATIGDSCDGTSDATCGLANV
jgi:hypothetical protein